MKSFFKIFKILTPKQMRYCGLLIALMFVCAFMEALGIGLVYPLIKIISEPEFVTNHQKLKPLFDFLGITTHRQLILFASFSLVAFYIFKNFIVLLQGKMQINFSLNNQKDYTKRLYKYYLFKPYLFHVNSNVALIGRNITNSGQIIFSEILINTLGIITEIISIIVIWLFILYIDWFLGLVVAFVLGPIIFLILNYSRKKVARLGSKQTAMMVENARWINQGFYSIKETKVIQAEDYFYERFGNCYSVYSEAQKKFLFVNRIPKSIIELVCMGGIILLVGIKTLLNSDPATLIPTLGVLALAAVRLMPSMNKIVGLFNSNKFKMPLFNEVYDDLIAVKEEKSFDESCSTKKNLGKIYFSKEIVVENLVFSYPEKEENVLNGINLTIPKGSFVGIVGPSGSGKTTFVDILLGLLPPKSGSIFVDGTDIYSNVSGWLDNVSYVPQSIYLIHGTIRDNVGFGVSPEKIDDKRVIEALKMAELYDFIQTSPDGIYMDVGDRGSKLSGGQKQRIGIARALYHNPEVLILDEATSALDNETEKQITETILRLKGKITIIAIAHRLSTLENCDFKIKFENGTSSIVD